MGKGLVKTLGAVFLAGVMAASGCGGVADFARYMDESAANPIVSGRGTDGKLYAFREKELMTSKTERDRFTAITGQAYAGPTVGTETREDLEYTRFVKEKYDINSWDSNRVKIDKIKKYQASQDK